MKLLTLLLCIIFSACNENQSDSHTNKDSAKKELPKAEKPAAPVKQPDTIMAPENLKPAAKVYSNKRFRNVTLKRTGSGKYTIAGEGQIFEASFSWVIEDGHNELQEGYVTTDAGAPAWGKFSFTINAVKKRPNSTLHIILFETSAKDGSRQYELPILLE